MLKCSFTTWLIFIFLSVGYFWPLSWDQHHQVRPVMCFAIAAVCLVFFKTKHTAEPMTEMYVLSVDKMHVLFILLIDSSVFNRTI